MPPGGGPSTSLEHGASRGFPCGASNTAFLGVQARAGRCPEVVSNRYTVAVAPTPASGAVSGGIGTNRGGAMEMGPYSVPYFDNTGDTINWIPTDIIVSPTDGGSLTTYICPAL